VGLKPDGTVVASGKNDMNQCNVSDWDDIVAIETVAYTVGLEEDGTVVAVGNNEYGQCDDVSGWSDIIAISASSRHVVGLKADGTVVAVGDNDDGQCNVSDWTDIVDIEAGFFYTVGLKADGTVIGSSTYDVFGKTMYDITMESMAKLGFPTNDPNAQNYWSDAILLVNDTKLNGSSKEGIRDTISDGGTLNTGERTQESNAYPATVSISAHHISMLLGDDLNDISQIFSDSENAVDRVALTIENMEKWGTVWIVFPNAVYGSSANYAAQYGYSDLFGKFDYTDTDSDAWELYN
jgi:hypothetical protein